MSSGLTVDLHVSRPRDSVPYHPVLL
jgi:hypothetical protein